MIIRARIILPMTAPPIKDGAVLISGGRISWLGPYGDLAPHVACRAEDWGEVVLLPGLINAHCHLEYTHLAGQLAPPKSFPDWIKSILAAKSAWGFSDYAQSWLSGARQSLQGGVTTVGDIASVRELLDVVRPAVPLRVHSFLEMTGVRSRQSPRQMLDEGVSLMNRLPKCRGGVGLSPHALYSTLPELLSQAAVESRDNGWRLSMHVAESLAEFDMFMYARGPMYDWLASQRPCSDCGTGSPVRLCEQYGLLSPRFLAAHVNYLWQDDAHRLARHGASVVHCPQSHAYFHHRRFPRVELMSAGVNVCIGTDSLASTRVVPKRPPRLSLLDELRTLSQIDALVSPADILGMATINGARSLGVAEGLGALFPGALADLTAIPFSGRIEDAQEAVVQYPDNVLTTWIAGECAWRCPDWN